MTESIEFPKPSFAQEGDMLIASIDHAQCRAEIARLKAESGAWTIGYQTAQIEAQAEIERLRAWKAEAETFMANSLETWDADQKEIERLRTELVDERNNIVLYADERNEWRAEVERLQAVNLTLTRAEKLYVAEIERLRAQLLIPCTDLEPHDAYCSGGPRCIKAMREEVEERYADENERLRVLMAAAIDCPLLADACEHIHALSDALAAPND